MGQRVETMPAKTQTQQLTFEGVRIRPYDGSKKCEKQITENGDIRKCSNTAYLTDKNPDEIIFRCWHHSKDTWKEVVKSKRLVGGK